MNKLKIKINIEKQTCDIYTAYITWYHNNLASDLDFISAMLQVLVLKILGANKSGVNVHSSSPYKLRKYCDAKIVFSGKLETHTMISSN